MPLTETDIKALKPHPERHRWVNDGAGLYLRDGAGLYLRIAPSDRRIWIWRTKRTRRATPPAALTVKDAFEEWYSVARRITSASLAEKNRARKKAVAQRRARAGARRVDARGSTARGRARLALLP